MRKLIVLSFLSMDGVMQAPGGPEEDTSGGFRFGGWVFPFFDEFLGQIMSEQMGREFDLLLGRKTYDIFAGYWPHQDDKDPTASALNKARKYVVTRTLEKAEWANSSLIRENIPETIRKLKDEDGPDIHVHGSANMIQTLWENDLVDELWLKIFPVVLGAGKRLFANEKFTGAFDLTDSRTSPSGVIAAWYKRSGKIKTGSF